MQKIILFYQFVPLSDPLAVCLWQRSLAESLNLRGRLIIADQGINGTLSGELSDLKAYIKQTKKYAAFKPIVFKWSEGSREDFPRLSVKVRPELVAFNVKQRIKVADQGIIGGGKRIGPEALHRLVGQKEIVFFDGRNAREAAIGRFKNAVVMDINHTRDFPQALKDNQYDELKDKTVVTYCTGGIRCEVLSKLMIDEGFMDVYQLDGGIAKYLEHYKDDGLWEGSLYVFDRRMSLDSSEKPAVIGSCVRCKNATKQYLNCLNQQCNGLVLLCADCSQENIICADCIGNKQLA